MCEQADERLKNAATAQNGVLHFFAVGLLHAAVESLVIKCVQNHVI